MHYYYYYYYSIHTVKKDYNNYYVIDHNIVLYNNVCGISGQASLFENLNSLKIRFFKGFMLKVPFF